jgi:hypothetical protein
VDHDRLAVGGQVDIELHPFGAGLERRPEGGQRVLREVRGVATVRMNARAGAPHRGDGRTAVDSPSGGRVQADSGRHLDGRSTEHPGALGELPTMVAITSSSTLRPVRK